jgi:hypothetical protein
MLFTEPMCVTGHMIMFKSDHTWHVKQASSVTFTFMFHRQQSINTPCTVVYYAAVSKQQ